MMRTVVTMAIVAGTLAAGAQADTLEWRIVSGWGIQGEVTRLAAEGFRVDTVVVNAPEPTVLLRRPCCRRAAATATYRIVTRDEVDRVAELGAQGYTLRAFGVDRGGVPLAVYELTSDAPGARHDYRSIAADLASSEAELGSLAADGFRAVAASGRTASKPDWLILERKPDTPARELKVIDETSATALEAALGKLAGQGYALDVAWGRTVKRFSLTGPERLAAVVSRPRGEARPVAHSRVTVASEPDSSSGALVSTALSRGGLAFVQRVGRSGSPWVRQVVWPSGDEAAWERWAKAEQELRSYQSRPIGSAWVVWSAGSPSSLVVREPDEVEAEASRRPADPAPALEIPADAQPLAEGGGAPFAAYLELLAGIRRGDLKGTKQRWTDEVAAAWAKRVEMFKAPLGLGFSEKSLFEDLPRELPTDPIVLGGWVRGAEAKLRVEGTVDGQRRFGDLDLRLEGGVWKLAKQSSWREL